MQHSLGTIIIHDSLTPMIGTLNYFERDDSSVFNFKVMDVKHESVNIFSLQTLYQFKTALSIINGNIPDDYTDFSLKVENTSVTINKLGSLIIRNTVNKKAIHRFKVDNKEEIHNSLSFIIGRIGIVISQIHLFDDFIKEGGDIKASNFNLNSLNVGLGRLIAPNLFMRTMNAPYCSFDGNEELISIGMGKNKIILDRTNESDCRFIHFLIDGLGDLKVNRNQKVYHDIEKPEHCRYISFARNKIINSEKEVTYAWSIVINTDTLIPGSAPSKLSFFIEKDNLNYFVDSFVSALKEKL